MQAKIARKMIEAWESGLLSVNRNSELTSAYQILRS